MESFLACTKCHQKSAIDSNYPRCRFCNEPLELKYIDLKKASIRKSTSIFERYRDFLPFVNVNDDISLGHIGTSTRQGNDLGYNRPYHTTIHAGRVGYNLGAIPRRLGQWNVVRPQCDPVC